jgi:hypothetical protein
MTKKNKKGWIKVSIPVNEELLELFIEEFKRHKDVLLNIELDRSETENLEAYEFTLAQLEQELYKLKKRN